MREITLKERRIQLVFDVGRPGRYFDVDKFKRHLHIDEAKVRLDHSSTGHTLTVVVPFDVCPHPGVITDAWNQHWEQDDREHEEKTNQYKLECDNIREAGFSAAAAEFYGTSPVEESLKELLEVANRRLRWAEDEYAKGDYSQASCYYNDADDLMTIGAHAKKLDRTRALAAASGLDTCVRETIPEKLWDWLHYEVREPQL